MTNNNKAQPEDRVRAQKALDLRLAGMTYSAIADSLDYADESGARKAVDRCLKQSTAEGVAELRDMEGQRLDRMQKAIWVNAVVNGDLDSIKTCLRIMDRRARLFGLDAPVKLRVDETMTDVEFAEKMAELVGAMEPDALGELLRGLPGTAGRSLLNADGPVAGTGMVDTLAALAADSDDPGAETTASPRPAGWSNIE